MTADAVSTSCAYTTKLGTKAKMKTARPVPAGFTS